MNEPPESFGPAESAPAFEAIASRQLLSWLAEQRVSLAFTTYQSEIGRAHV